MEFRLPAKYALFIINLLVLSYFFLYFCVIGIEYQDTDNNITIIFKGLNFDKSTFIAPEINANSIIQIAFGHVNLFFEYINNQNRFIKSLIALDSLIITMLIIQCFVICLSFINLFIWRGFKKAKTIDIGSKILILSFIIISITWIIIMSDVEFLIKDTNEPTKYILFANISNMQEPIYWVGQSFMPALFIFVHTWMNAPLYRKRKKY
ncbi:hypothetical protein [Spiroplasma diminutum]|uniref:Transmembrane protein n=1 Tax=Spiroplasma diminutum CUAS-1 TaxID=1276221 RepID=S5MET5_9MOLU|nr:hypothetical protein [Spiroplasma diminutum]AGR42278.1 hypothetical protein SDIMI_v3c05740 [Spiroplasma diminutum CUAS-1]